MLNSLHLCVRFKLEYAGKGIIMAKNETEQIVELIDEIKKDILKTRVKMLVEANKELIFLYFRIGKTISENKKYGSNFINTLSTSLKIDFPNATGFSPRNLARMRKFYETYLDFIKFANGIGKIAMVI